LNSIKSTVAVQSFNISIADPCVYSGQELHSSKPQQPGTFVIKHKEISAILREKKKFIILYAHVQGFQIDNRQIIPKTPDILKKTSEDESSRQISTAWTE